MVTTQHPHPRWTDTGLEKVEIGPVPDRPPRAWVLAVPRTLLVRHVRPVP